MQKERWQKIGEIFERAIALPPDERHRFVGEVCRDDGGLCRELLVLIDADRAAASFLDEELYTLGLECLKSEDDFPAETQLAYYRLKKLLGRGGMGVVYLAEDTRLERLVALKILTSPFAADALNVERFRQEARTASAISHQNVAHIYDFGEADDRFYLAMEYVRGETLRAFLKAGRLDAAAAVDIALQITEALAATHRQGIVHRDIKPENVIITESGLVKVLDFGVSKLLGLATPDWSLQTAKASLVHTTPGMVMGTIGYISPEQLQNKKVDFRADIWSVGVCLYEMLAGRRPFEGATAEEIGEAISTKEPVLSFPSVAAEQEKLVKNIIAKALSKNAGGRYESASALADELRELKKRIEPVERAAFIDPANENRRAKNREPGERISDFRFLTRTREIWTGQSLSRKVLLSTAAVGLMTFGLGISAQYFEQPQAGERSSVAIPAKKKLRALAVLPFENKTADPKMDFLAMGLADDLIRNLGRADAFSVTSLATTQKIREKNISRGEIKQNLKIETLLEGEIKVENTVLYIETRLIDLTDERPLWTEKLSIPDGEPLKLRNALTLLLSNKLQESEDSAKKLVFAEYPTADNEAYRLYLEGKFGRREMTVGELKRLIGSLEQSVARDPDYTLALIALAENYNLLGTFMGQQPEYYQPKAEATLKRALALDESLSEAHTLLGKIEMDFHRDWAASEREFARAIEADPNNAQAHHWYGEVFLSAMGRLDESVAELETAHRLNPLSTGVLTGLAWAHIGKGDYGKAIELCDRAQTINPNDNDVYQYRAQALFKLDRFDEAVREMNEAIRRDPETTRYYALKAVFLAAGGRREEAARFLAEIKTKPSSRYSQAIVENALGNRDRAFELLNMELQTKSVDLLSIGIDPLLDTMRGDPRFRRIEKLMNLPVNEGD